MRLPLFTWIILYTLCMILLKNKASLRTDQPLNQYQDKAITVPKRLHIYPFNTFYLQCARQIIRKKDVETVID